MNPTGRARGAWRCCVLAWLAGAACSSPGSSPEGVLVLGAILPLSGPGGRTGEQILTGLELACESSGGPKTTLRVVDGAGSPLTSSEHLQAFAGDPEVHAVVGGWFSATARTLSAIAGETDLAFVPLSPLALGAERPAGSFPLHGIPALARGAAFFASEELGAQHAGVVRLEDNEVSRMLADAFETAFPGKVRWTTVPGEPGRLDLPPSPPRVDVIYVAGPGEWAREASRRARRPKSAAILTAEGWNDDGLWELVDDGVAVYVVSFFSPTDPSPASRRLLETCASLGREPTPAVALGWDAAQLIRRAAASGGLDRAAIRGALPGGGLFEGATGRIDVSPGGVVRETPAVSSLTRGGVVFLKRVETAARAGA